MVNAMPKARARAKAKVRAMPKTKAKPRPRPKPSHDWWLVQPVGCCSLLKPTSSKLKRYGHAAEHGKQLVLHLRHHYNDADGHRMSDTESG